MDVSSMRDDARVLKETLQALSNKKVMFDTWLADAEKRAALLEEKQVQLDALDADIKDKQNRLDAVQLQYKNTLAQLDMIKKNLP